MWVSRRQQNLQFLFLGELFLQDIKFAFIPIKVSKIKNKYAEVLPAEKQISRSLIDL